jgi:calcium/calmodulin-dependent protein kinase I
MLNHQYVSHLLDGFDWGPYQILIFPRLMGGSLCEAVQNAKYKTLREVAQIMLRLLVAVQYLHRRNIVHGDISPNNILFEDDYPILIDFGTSQIIPDGGISRIDIGTDPYCAPERKLKESTLAVDIYSLGATFCYLLEGNESMRMIDGLWRDSPASLMHLVRNMLNVNASSRMSAEECLGHQFFRDILSEEWIVSELSQNFGHER